ncbi:MAG: SDR family NAD(P)-dependent oxidoreductase [Alphaproteobacteria bacterium]|jgi:NAD(P)-dependent dehydrogenase (short-subunit alcohol dehydrogenase family)|nr:SDR family NAD(P)-dependent oxidoreductase [Alphaproteobacteria bacterium]MDP6566762.1 SDR family NAD(P)-dependent oxidoreductase [Alphaproteobacteria bacterium]MDP6812972.1 SDR family NAD(P)-dependent oxidoreductase [Alphaproteobacteria bacterium]
MDIAGKAAMVTGGASGLGGATARALALGGAKVAVLDLNEELGRQVAGEIGGLFVQADAADEAQAEAAFGAAREAHGPARILINAAGIAATVKTTSRGRPHPMDAFERVIRVNLLGTFNCIRLAATDMAALEPMADGERGAIVNTASAAAYDGQIGQAAYAASKGGVVGMTLPIARDLSDKGIRVCTIAPGLFDTPLLQGTLTPEIKAALEASVPFPKRLGDPAEFAAMAVQICENVMLNGETIRLDGAIRMAPR